MVRENVKNVCLAYDEDGLLQLFYIGLDGHLYYRYQDLPSYGWSSESLFAENGVFINSISDTEGTLYVYYITTGNVLVQRYLTASAWSADGGNPPEHTTIVPFTRGLAGPMDFTFGTFNFKNPVLPGTRVQTNIAKQVALYMIIYSPLQMASDLPENSKDNEAFGFIQEVPTDWEDTRILDARIGDYVIIARKDRHSDEWYLGAITDENARVLTIDLSFLAIDCNYKAQIIADGEKADWDTNPTNFQYREQTVQSGDKLVIRLAPGGGEAVRFMPAKE